MVVSASHNPYHDNGVKLISSSGMKFPDAVEANLEKFIVASDGATPIATKMHLDGDEKLHEDYLDALSAGGFAGREICRNENRAGLREWRVEPAGAAAVSFAGRGSGGDE